MKNPLTAIGVFVILLVGGLAADLSAKPKMNPAAEALAKELAPPKPPRSFKPDSVAALSKKAIPILETLHRSNVTSGPGAESLLSKALDSREDVESWETMLLSRALLDALKKANYMRLFDEDGNFTTKVVHGSRSGEKVLFELIVPGEVYPQASNHLANLRLVSVSEQRKPDTPLTPRENATYQQLVKLIDARSDFKEAAKQRGPETDDMGLTRAESDKLWEKAREEAGDAADAVPNINIEAKMEASPTHMTDYRWRIACEFRNLSSFPTEVMAEVWLIGITDEKRDHYIMQHQTFPLKLRAGEGRDIDVFTKSEKSYKNKADDHDELDKKERKKSRVRYRGFAIQVHHNDEIITFHGGDALMTDYVNPTSERSRLGFLPKF